MNNGELREEYLNILNELNGDEEGRRAAWNRMSHGFAVWGGKPAAMSYIPHCLTLDTRAYVARITERMCDILMKIICRYREYPEYREEFRFDERVRELVLIPDMFDCVLPVARIDFIMDDDTKELHFCEFNTDSSSGMAENVESKAAVTEGNAYGIFAKNHSLSDDEYYFYEGFVKKFTKIYERCCSDRLLKDNNVNDDAIRGNFRPRIAIAVLFDSPTPDAKEQESYIPLFNKYGYDCSVFDVREIEYNDGVVYGRKAIAGDSNVKIDCIWRFCIMVDLLVHWNEVGSFIQAIRENAVPFIGGFATQIVHDKQLFAILRRSATKEFLTEEECKFIDRYVPYTAFLDDESTDIEEIKCNKDKYIIKPTDWYGSKNVIPGRQCSKAEWENAIDACINEQSISPYLVQEFNSPFKSLTVPLYGDEEDYISEPREYGNLYGAYAFEGEFGGIYLRQGPYDVIGSAKKGIVAPVVWVNS